MLRLAHLTDIHVQPERKADQGLRACLHHVQSLDDRPDLILNGGDTIMDAFAATRERTQAQWDLWHAILKNECSLPVEHTIGNHDLWGWSQSSSGATGSEPLYGKNWALDAFGLDRRYRSFDRAGWHFIVLDSTHPGPQPGSYEARLDEEQFDWLAGDLAATDPQTPVLVLSHIPILSAAAFFDGDNVKDGNWLVPGSWMHLDARRIKDLFRTHPNVKLCLSGHLHQVDRVDFNNVAYLCNGAVSGAWWRGDYYEFAPGYAIIDLFDDGSFAHAFLTYGWTAES